MEWENGQDFNWRKCPQISSTLYIVDVDSIGYSAVDRDEEGRREWQGWIMIEKKRSGR